jgi:hypothetical protein
MLPKKNPNYSRKTRNAKAMEKNRAHYGAVEKHRNLMALRRHKAAAGTMFPRVVVKEEDLEVGDVLNGVDSLAEFAC